MAQQSVFEVLAFTKTPLRGMDANHWYIESVHQDLSEGMHRYDQLSRAWPDPRIVIVLVRSEFDEEAGIFRDRVLRARARSTMLSRRTAKPMPSEARRALHDLSTGGGGGETAGKPRPKPRATRERRSGNWLGFVLAGLAGAGVMAATLAATGRM